MADNYQEHKVSHDVRPWGSYTLLFGNIDFKGKSIDFNVKEVKGKGVSSLYSLADRDHYFFILNGNVVVYRGTLLVPALGVKDMRSYSLESVNHGNIVIPRSYPFAFENCDESAVRLLEFSFGQKSEGMPCLYERLGIEERMLSMKILDVNAKSKLSVQRHEHRAEYWQVLAGEVVAFRASVELGGDDCEEAVQRARQRLEAVELKEGENILIKKGDIHSLENLTNGAAKVLELSFGKYDENDITRYADIYGRVK